MSTRASIGAGHERTRRKDDRVAAQDVRQCRRDWLLDSDPWEDIEAVSARQLTRALFPRDDDTADQVLARVAAPATKVATSTDNEWVVPRLYPRAGRWAGESDAAREGQTRSLLVGSFSRRSSL
jgi:hypothetical protein